MSWFLKHYNRLHYAVKACTLNAHQHCICYSHSCIFQSGLSQAVYKINAYYPWCLCLHLHAEVSLSALQINDISDIPLPPPSSTKPIRMTACDWWVPAVHVRTYPHGAHTKMGSACSSWKQMWCSVLRRRQYELGRRSRNISQFSCPLLLQPILGCILKVSSLLSPLHFYKSCIWSSVYITKWCTVHLTDATSVCSALNKTYFRPVRSVLINCF